MAEPERTELIAALHELTIFAEGLLEANGRQLEALADETPPTPAAVADDGDTMSGGSSRGGLPQAPGGAGD